MPRKARLILNNACYHVITRGNQKQQVFKEHDDFYTYLGLLSKYKKRFNSKIYGYCLMGNHVHLLMKSDMLTKFMHGINLSYAQYFKYKYKIIGHFWQDRYKSFVVQKDTYMLDCITYIEYNPVRAKMVSSIQDYPWSSYKARVLGKNDKILDQLIL